MKKSPTTVTSPGSLDPVQTLGGRPEPSYFSCYLGALTGPIPFVLLMLLLALLLQLLVLRALAGV